MARTYTLERPDRFGYTYGPFIIRQTNTGSGMQWGVYYGAQKLGKRETRGRSGTMQVIYRCVALCEQLIADGTLDRLQNEAVQQ